MVKKMNTIQSTLRPAIAMIELIFAIVIIGITLLSAPLVLNQSIKSSSVAIQQESIAAAATQISLILTHSWDESDTNATYGILNVSASGAPALANGTRDINTSYLTRRYNTIAGFTDATPANRLGMEINDLNNTDDIDDFHNDIKNLTLYAGESLSLSNNQGEYIDKNITMANTVTYANKAAVDYTTKNIRLNNPFVVAANSTNIKLINVRLTTPSVGDELDKVVVLGAFTCNIGVPNLTSPQNYRILP